MNKIINMFSSNTKTSYTPITVGNISLNGSIKNTSPKVNNYFLPTPPASPTYKDNNSPNDDKSKNDKDINIIMKNMKENQFSKLNLEIYDYFWNENLIFVMCIYNGYIPICIYLNSDVNYENSILTKVDDVSKAIKDDCLIYELEADNILEKYDKGIVIKINKNYIHYLYINDVEIQSDVRHSIVPLILFDNIVNNNYDFENKFEPILNLRLVNIQKNINETKLKYDNILKSFLDFESLYYNNIKLIIDKIVSIKHRKKQLLDDYNYYSKNNIIVNGNDKNDFDVINSKLVSYFAYYEKYLSYQLIINKINKDIQNIELLLKYLNDDMNY